jgi:hypothetical protein
MRDIDIMVIEVERFLSGDLLCADHDTRFRWEGAVISSGPASNTRNSIDAVPFGWA